MKASIKFREERPPLLRAKVPIGVLGLPFVSGIVASASAAEGDAEQASRELRLDLATAFQAGPSLRLSYRPNDARNPFSVVLKTGVGAFGSPSAGSPLSMSAEFGLLRGSRPTFSLFIKPRFGDFTLRRSFSATAVVAPAVDDASTPLSVKVAPVGHGHAIETPIMEFRPLPIIDECKKVIGFPIDVSTFTAGSRSGVDGLLTGMEFNARSVLPLHNRTSIHFKWGLKVPPELQTAFDDRTAGISMRKLPLLVMNKISIERLADDKANAKEKKKAPSTKDEDVGGSVRQELEALKANSGMMRRAFEELRAEVRAWKLSPAASPGKKESGKPLDKSGKLEDINVELTKPLKASSFNAAADEDDRRQF